MSTVETRIEKIERMNNSKDGNPRFRLHTADGAYATMPDASVAYGIENPEYQEGRVRLTLNSKGQVEHAEVVR